MRRTTHHHLPELSRRALLTATGAGTLSLVAGCSFFSTDPAGGGSGAAADKGPEAPELAELVEAGELPPLEERLPKTPLVVEPVEAVGSYGRSEESRVGKVRRNQL